MGIGCARQPSCPSSAQPRPPALPGKSPGVPGSAWVHNPSSSRSLSHVLLLVMCIHKGWRCIQIPEFNFAFVATSVVFIITLHDTQHTESYIRHITSRFIQHLSHLRQPNARISMCRDLTHYRPVRILN